MISKVAASVRLCRPPHFSSSSTVCGARYKTRPGLTYHYKNSHKDRDPSVPVGGYPHQQQQHQQPQQQHHGHHSGGGVVEDGGSGGGGGGGSNGHFHTLQPASGGMGGGAPSGLLPPGPGLPGGAHDDNGSNGHGPSAPSSVGASPPSTPGEHSLDGMMTPGAKEGKKGDGTKLKQKGRGVL